MKNECLMKEYDFDGVAFGDERCVSGKTFLNKSTRKYERNEEEMQLQAISAMTNDFLIYFFGAKHGYRLTHCKRGPNGNGGRD